MNNTFLKYRSYSCTLHLLSPITPVMAHPLSRLLSRRVCQQRTPFPKTPSFASRNLQASAQKPLGRRSYATGESGPNPKSGKSPLKVWPFIAIALAGSGAYVLMVRSRASTSQSTITMYIFKNHRFISRAALTTKNSKRNLSRIFI